MRSWNPEIHELQIAQSCAWNFIYKCTFIYQVLPSFSATSSVFLPFPLISRLLLPVIPPLFVLCFSVVPLFPAGLLLFLWLFLSSFPYPNGLPPFFTAWYLLTDHDVRLKSISRQIFKILCTFCSEYDNQVSLVCVLSIHWFIPLFNSFWVPTFRQKLDKQDLESLLQKRTVPP